MLNDRAGFHVKQRGKTNYHTFSPTPICDVNIQLDEEMCSLLSTAHRQFGLLEGYCRRVSNIENVNHLSAKKRGYRIL